MGFAEADAATLATIRENLFRGLDAVGEHVTAGTLDLVPDGGATPPGTSGWLMVVLLRQVSDELRSRSAVPPD